MKGNYSEYDKTNWTPELKKALKYDQMQALQNDNGNNVVIIIIINNNYIIQYFKLCVFFFCFCISSFSHFAHNRTDSQCMIK